MNKKQLIAVLVVTILFCYGCLKINDISSIKGVWEPLSRVYLNFGTMTVEDNLLGNIGDGSIFV